MYKLNWLNVTIQPACVNQNPTALFPSINNLHPAPMENSGPPVGTAQVATSHLEMQNCSEESTYGAQPIVGGGINHGLSNIYAWALS